jgi:uncharacterized membrane protein
MQVSCINEAGISGRLATILSSRSPMFQALAVAVVTFLIVTILGAASDCRASPASKGNITR